MAKDTKKGYLICCMDSVLCYLLSVKTAVELKPLSADTFCLCQELKATMSVSLLRTSLSQGYHDGIPRSLSTYFIEQTELKILKILKIEF